MAIIASTLNILPCLRHALFAYHVSQILVVVSFVPLIIDDIVDVCESSHYRLLRVHRLVAWGVRVTLTHQQMFVNSVNLFL